MAQGGRTGKRLEIVSAKAGNYTPVEDEFELCVAQNWVSLLNVFLALLSDAPTLPSGCCGEGTRSRVGAILVVFGGNLFIDIICVQKHCSTQIINPLGDFGRSRVWLRILKVAVTFGGMKAYYIHLLCHRLVFHCTFDTMKPS